MPVISARMPVNAVMKGEFDMRSFPKTTLFRKLILLLLAFVLLASMLAGCQSESSYEPLTEEKVKEIRTAWETATNPPFGNRDYHYLLDFSSPENYYGTHGDCIALFYGFRDVDADGSTYIPVAGQYIHSEFASKIYIYRKGEFKEIIIAYEDGWLTKEQVASIAEHHKSTSNYCECYENREE